MMLKLFSILSVVLLYSTIAFGQVFSDEQAFVDIPLIASDGTNVLFLAVGVDLTATNGIDPALGETDLPPFPPTGVFECRFDLFPYAGSNLSSYLDYRNAPAFPFTGVVEHTLWFQMTDVGTDLNLDYNLPTGATMTIVDVINGTFVNLGPFSGTGTAVIPGSYTAFGSKVFVNMDYTSIGPVGPAPEFVIAPTSLDFGAVGVGVPSMLQATVSNPGTDPLEITGITSSDAQFTYTPATATIPAGGNQIFDITFTPTSLGTQSADIEFTHNAPTSPDILPVTGVGADAGPTFGVSPTSLAYGVVLVGLAPVQTLTVRNDGLSNDLSIASASTTNAEYTVDPNPPTTFPIVITPGTTYDFDVTFAPLVAGTSNGDVEFVHDGTTSPDAVPVTGIGFIPASVFGLVFEEDSVFNLEEDFYPATMQLLDLPPGPAVQALQFRLLTNQAVDDNTILTFQNIVKGSDVASADWILEYNVLRGPIQSNGASQDEIIILLYNLNVNNGLPGGTNYNDLFTVNYRVADLPALTDSVKSSFLITSAEASTFEGFPITITPSRDELVVIAKNRVGSFGDVNGDGCVDILDLIMVVDHIVGRDSLDAEEFARADIAPWTPGNPGPDPDGFVNVQDLSLIQNIILTGFFPDGTPLGGCPSGFAKFNGEADAILNLYINNDGITVYLDSRISIRGAQIEFGNMDDDPNNMVINTSLGDGYYLKVENMLRTLMYDQVAEKYLESGTYQFMADMPFTIANPEDISLDRIILVDMDQRKVMKLEVNIIYTTPTLPYEYILFQNYPNPFNPTTEIRFQIPETGNVTVRIYDMLGQEIRTLFAGVSQRGTYTVQWDGLNDSGTKMSSGSYIYRMTAGDFVQSKKMILLK